jgi:hypothetical protein
MAGSGWRARHAYDRLGNCVPGTDNLLNLQHRLSNKHMKCSLRHVSWLGRSMTSLAAVLWRRKDANATSYVSFLKRKLLSENLELSNWPWPL